MPEDELNEQEEIIELEPFLVEDEDEADRVCMTCSKYKVGTKVCGIFKPYRDYMKSHGINDVETTFTCGEYKEEV